MIDIKDIGLNSTLRIEAQCDVCGRIKTLQYKKYNKNISHGGYYCCSNFCAKDKVESTNLEKYGTKYPLQSTEKVVELKKYFLEKFGVDNPSKVKEVCDSRETTMLERFGVKTNIILPETHNKAIKSSTKLESKTKRMNTLIDRFGVDNCMKSKEIYDKFKQTNLLKYGHEFPAQNSEIFNKIQKSQLKSKIYKNLSYQGTYELDFLVFCEINKLLNKVSKPSSIKYLLGDSYKTYHPDFYIEDLNLIVEVKSEYYYNLYLEKNLCKQQSCLHQGYNFIFIINKNYDEFLKMLEKSS
jgi:hypothetical protein